MSKRLIAVAAAVLSLCGLVGGVASAAPAKPAAPAAQPVYGPDTCILGYVWREVTSSDHVCVTSDRRAETQDDNSKAASRVNPTGPYGPDTCVQGYVWREAIANDHVCVVPSRRDDARADNAAASGRLLSAHIVIPATIVFGGGVPVGGWANLTVYPDGSYNFSGHFHVSGATSYNVGIVMAISDPTGAGTAFVFSDKGHVAGTFEPGSRDYDFNQSGNNPAIKNAWNNMMQHGYGWGWSSNASWDLVGLLNQVKTYIGYAQTVIQVVGAI